MKPVLKQLLFSRGIVKNGLVFWLEGEDFFNSPPTTTWGDRSGNRNNATPSGMAYTTSSGSDGVGGVVFDGVDDSCSLPLNLTTGNYTLEFRGVITASEYLFDTLVGRMVVSLGSSFSYGYIGFYDGVWKNFSVTFPLGVLTHFLITFDKDNTVATLYLNNIMIGTQPYAWKDISGGTRIMSNNAESANRTSGKLKLFRVYNRILNGSERTQNYNASR